MALENALFQDVKQDVKKGRSLLFLWQNRPCVVIGRNQNPWHEAFLPAMERDGVPLVRRQSGGGAVYHDEGNLNFSFINGHEGHRPPSPHLHLQWVRKALEEDWRIPQIQVTDHHDLVIESQGQQGEQGETLKFSGSAFKHTLGRSLHHGTLLIDSDLSRLNFYLNPPKGGPWEGERALSGVLSRKAKAINLRQLNSSLTVDSMARSLAKVVRGEIELFDISLWLNKEKVKDFIGKMESWAWRFGQTPPFSQIIYKKDKKERSGETFGHGHRWDIHRGIVEKIEMICPSVVPSSTSDFLQRPYGLPLVEEFLSWRP